MNRMLKKAVAVMLAVFTVTSVIPFTAFAQNPSDVSYTEDESFALDGSNAIGNEISELSQQQEEAEEGADYAVSWVEIEGNLATVDLVNIESCTVEVAIFSENGRMLASGYTDAPERAGTAEVWIDIDEMPEFFVAEVFLLDENMASLCDSYYCDRYTESFQEFLDLTIYDFEDQIVVNYDEEIDNNFAVAKDGTQEAEQNGDKNILVSADDENGIYVFENADKTITGVSVGENLFYDLGDGDYILIKVASNITEGNLTTVTADDAEIGDLYDCIKIDETAVIVDESCVDTTDMDSSLTLVGVEKPAPKFRAIDVSGEIGAKVGLDLLYEKKGEPFKIEGEITAEVTASVKFYHKTKGKNKTEFKLDTKYSIGYDIVFSASGSKEKGVDLPKLKLSILPGLTFESKLTLKFEVSGSVGIEGGKTIHRGFSYDNKNKTRTWNTEEEEWFPKSKGLSFEIKTELEIKATLEGLKVLEAELKIGIGLGASGTFQDVTNEEGAEKKHLCTRCCPAEFYAFANMKVSLKVGYKRLKITLLSFKVFDRKWKLFDFYFSNLSSGIFKTCPHYEYKTVFVVKDTAGNPLPNIKILDSATNQNGEHHTYYAPGNKYNISVSPDGYLPATIIFNVEEEVTTVPITLTPVRMTDIKVSALPSKLSYFTGDTLDTAGLELTGSYNNGKAEKITSGFTVTPTKLTTAGTQTVTVDYNGLKTSFNVSVTQLAVTKLEIKNPPSKTEYFVGETVDTTGLVLTETYNNGVVKTITSGYTVAPEELTVPGSQTVTLTYGGKTCTYSINVTPVVATGISIKTPPSKTDYFVGDMLDTTGLVLEETYNNGDVVTITSGYTCTHAMLSEAGMQTVTVTYGDNSCTFVIEVTPVVATGISVKNPPSKTKYYVGDVLDTTGLVLEETYNNGDVVTVTSGYTCTPLDLIDAGTQTVTVTYGENQCEFDVEVIPVVATKIEIVTRPDKTIYFTGDTLDTTGLTLKETYNNGDIVTVTSGYTCTPETLSTVGTQNITVTYGDNSCDYLVDVYDSSEYGGICGDNLIWAFEPITESTGSLIINGTGAMYDWSSSSKVPWNSYLNLIKSISIAEGVTRIGDYAFENCKTLTSVTIPDSVTSIGDHAFGYCYAVTNLSIGKGVTNIGDYAFCYCRGLTSVTIPDSVTSIGKNAFSDCYAITNVSIGAGVTSISDYAFTYSYLEKIIVDPENKTYSNDEYGVLFNKDKTLLISYPGGNERTGYTIPDSVTSIGDNAFRICDNLSGVIIGNSVTSIGDDAFKGCRGLTEIRIPDSVTNIGNYVFAGCSALEGVIIGNGLTSIGEYVFSDCSKLVGVTIGKGLTRIGKNMFSGCIMLNNITIPDNVTNIGEYAFYGCYYLSSVAIPNSVTNIGEYAFMDCIALENVTIPCSVTNIGEYAFYNCQSLKKIILSDGVTSIGRRAFFGCYALTNITIPDSVSSIGEYTFSDCFALKSVTIGKGLTSISDYMFYKCNELSSVTMSDSIKGIGLGTFSDCYYLRNITIPDSVTSIGAGAFENCISLISITIPDSVTSIGVYTFNNCDNLTNITVDADNTKYSSDEYGVLFNKNKSELIQYPTGNERTDYTIPNKVTSIGMGAFNGCDYLENILIPNSVSDIGSYAFANCTKLGSIIIPSNVFEIEEYTFYNSSLKSLTLSSVCVIYNCAFYNCSIKNLTLTRECCTIFTDAFASCWIDKVYYVGTEEDWNELCDSLNGPPFSWTNEIHFNHTLPTPQTVVNETQTVNSSAKSIAPPLIPVYPTDSSVKKVMVSNAVVGNRYTLIALDQTEREYSLDNLVFIDNTIAEEKSFWLSFMPKSFDNPVVLVIGDFGSGIEQRRCNVYDGTAVDSITLSHSALEMYMGQEPVQLSYEITPEPVENKTVLWSSDNNSVAQVDGEGNVYPCAPGKATVTATTAQGGVTASCEVTITERVFEISWILTDKTVTEEVTEGYSIAEYADTGRYGYSFNGWTPAVPNRMPGNDLSFTAVYEPVICNVLFDANGGLWADGTTESITSSVAFDSEITAPQSPSKQGYIFSGWSLDGENTETDTGIMNDVDGKEFIAVWIPATDTRYTVETYVMNTAGEYEKSSQIYSGTTDETVYASYDVEEGFVLNDEKSVLSGVVKGDNSLVLKVYTDRNAYTFTTVVDGVSTSADYLYGATVAEPAEPSKAGYKFIGWNNSTPSTMPAENVTVTAEFVKSYICPDCGDEILGEAEINAHITAEGRMKATVKIKNNNGSKTINYGETLRLTAITNNMPADAKIYWYIDGEMKGEGETFNVRFESGTKTVEVKIVDSNGNVLKNAGGNEIKDSESVTVKGGFFRKIISFFKNLFGMNRTVIQSVFKGIF